MRVGFFRYWLFHDPNWDYRTIDWDRDLAYAEQKLPFMAAVEQGPDAVQEARRQAADVHRLGGPGRAAAGHRRVLRGRREGDGRTRDRREISIGFFIAPGMGHCAGGPGPNQFDAIGALEQWVEKGIAPDKLIATHSTNGKVDRTRPLCLYPLVARYKGTGSSDEAANFACVAAPAAAPAAKTTTSTGASDEIRDRGQVRARSAAL